MNKSDTLTHIDLKHENCKKFYYDLRDCLTLYQNTINDTKVIKGELLTDNSQKSYFDFTKCTDEFDRFKINAKWHYVTKIQFDFTDLTNPYIRYYKLNNVHNILSIEFSRNINGKFESDDCHL